MKENPLHSSDDLLSRPSTLPTGIEESARQGTAHWIAYHRLDFEAGDEIEDGRPVLEPVLRSGLARLVVPAPGIVLQGTLVDCPESQGGVGCVVVHTGQEDIAVQSAALCDLVIEHAPCHLEFVAVSHQLQDRAVSWDWEAYEISPNGPRILVSESAEEHTRAVQPRKDGGSENPPTHLSSSTASLIDPLNVSNSQHQKQ